MGLDIFFQAFDAKNDKLGEQQEMRCREVYHAMNRWCEARKRSTPSNGERLSIDAKGFAEIAPAIRDAIADVDTVSAAAPPAEAFALGDEWLVRIWPPGTARIEYWFTA